MPAREAAYAYIGAEALDPPLSAAAGVRLAQRERLAKPEDYDGHEWPILASSALMLSRIVSAAARAASAKPASFEA